MDVVYGLIPMMLFFGVLLVVLFIWMAKSGQFDDLDGAAHSIFMEDEYEEDIEQTDKEQQAEKKSNQIAEKTNLPTETDKKD